MRKETIQTFPCITLKIAGIYIKLHLLKDNIKIKLNSYQRSKDNLILGNYIYVLCIHSVQFSSVAQSCLTLCDPMNHSMPGHPVHYQLPEFTQTHMHTLHLIYIICNYVYSMPGESQGQRSLVGCRLRGCTESDTTKATQQQQPL